MEHVTYEYEFVTLPGTDKGAIIDVLNGWGQKGWRVVSYIHGERELAALLERSKSA
jgi:hypothetical protein